MPTIFNTAANVLASALESATRDDGSTYVRLKECYRDTWVQEAIYAAHDGGLPDDWTYSACHVIALDLADYDDEDSARDALHEVCDNAVNITHHSLYQWGARFGYWTEEARQMGLIGEGQDVPSQLQAGQYAHLQNIAYTLLDAVTERAAEMEDADGEEE